MAKKLQIWNGRGYSCENFDDDRWKETKGNSAPHAYVAAYSVADACRVIGEYCGRDAKPSEIKTYFSEGCWSTVMNDITPERGLWLGFDRNKPVRVI